jgi:hypothetical protein
MISFGGQVTADEYVAAHQLHRQQRGWKRVGWVVVRVLLGVGGLLSADIAVQNPKVGLTPLLLILPIAAVQLVVRLVYLPRRVRSVYSQQRNLQLPFESVCTDTGIESSNANSINRLPWSELIRWKESGCSSCTSRS